MSLSLLRKVVLHTPDTPERPVEPVSWSETPDLGTQRPATDVFSSTMCFEGWQRMAEGKIGSITATMI